MRLNCPLCAKSGHSARRTVCQTDEKQRDRLEHKAASKRDKDGDRVPLSFKLNRRFILLRNTLSELIKSGLFFGETTFYKAFLFSSQECLQNFSI